MSAFKKLLEINHPNLRSKVTKNFTEVVPYHPHNAKPAIRQLWYHGHSQAYQNRLFDTRSFWLHSHSSWSRLPTMTSSHILPIILAFVSLFAAQAQNGSDLDQSANELGSQDMLVRQKASEKLWNAGRDATDALSRLASNDDPEISRRAALLLKRIELNLTSDTPAEILDLLDRYDELDSTARINALKKLDKPKFALTLLKLWSKEKSFRVRDTVEDIVSKALNRAVQSALAENDPESAEELLKRLPNQPNSSVWLAGLYAANDKLEQKIAELEAEQDQTRRPLLLACYRRAGLLDQALELAREMKDQESLASLSLLKGNHLPYFEWSAKSGKGSAQGKVIKILRAQEEGKSEEALEAAKELLAEIDKKRSSSDRERNFQILHLTGFYELSIPSMKSTGSSRLYSLDYTNMNTSKWLDRHDLPFDATARRKWIAGRIRNIAKGVAVPAEEIGKIFAVAGHFYNLGEKDKAWELVNQLKDASKKAGGAQWGSFKEQIYSYFQFGLSVEEIEPNWKESDYLRLLSKFYSSDDEVKKKLWEEISKAGDLSLRERFDLIADFYGWSDAPHSERILSWKKMIELGGDHPDLLDLFLEVGQDFLPVKIVIEGILARDDRFEDLSATEQRFSLGQFVVIRDWKRALELFERMEDPIKSHPALAVGILRNAGRQEEAEEALTYALNDCVVLPSRLGELSQELEVAGCYEEALALKRRMAIELSPKSSAWKQNLEWLWKESISKGEAKKARALALAISVSSVEGNAWGSYTEPLSNYLRVQTCRSLDLVKKGKAKEAIEIIDKAITPIPGSTSIADIFIENINREAFPKVYQHVFQYSYQHYNKVIADHPKMVRPRNGLAWLCAVSELHLEEAERHSIISLTNNPDGSYYDTLARIHRGFGNFDEEFRIQKHAVNSSSSRYLGSVSEIIAAYDDILRRRAKK